MKKPVLFTSLVLVISILVTGCGTDGTEQTAQSETNASSSAPQTSSQDAPAVSSEETPEPSQELGAPLGAGDSAPDFTFTLLDDSQISLQEMLQEKPVFINAFATWCGPCKAEMPIIQELAEDYKEEIHLIVANVGEDKNTVETYISEGGYTLPCAYDSDGTFDTSFGVLAFPTSYFITSDGTIQEVVMGARSYEDYKELIEAML